MLYLSHFEFLSVEEEYDVIGEEQRTCYDSFYPFFILSKHYLEMLDFEPITILYGGNGSGKTTALNVIAEKLKLNRDTLYNRSNFFEDYTKLCRYSVENKIPKQSRIIASDDVFDFMLNIRSLNEGIDNRREELFNEFYQEKYSHFKMRSLDDYETLKKVNKARNNTQSKYVRKSLMDNVNEHSNGESAFIYFSDKIRERGLYLLDEPENSLSPENQIKLVSFIEECSRDMQCQFIIATHSPFLLSIKGAKIYDMDEETVDVKKWTKLKNVKLYYNFFRKHKDEFEDMI